MAKQTICFRSNAGVDFPTEFEALRDDLRFFILCHCGNNEKIARDVSSALIEALEPNVDTEFDGIARLVRRLAETKPADDPTLPFVDRSDFVNIGREDDPFTRQIGPGRVIYDDSGKQPNPAAMIDD